MYQKTIANIIGNGEKSKALPLKSGTNPGVHSVHSLSPVPGFLLEQDWGEKQKGTERKEDSQVSSFVHGMAVHRRLLKAPPELLR